MVEKNRQGAELGTAHRKDLRVVRDADGARRERLDDDVRGERRERTGGAPECPDEGVDGVVVAGDDGDGGRGVFQASRQGVEEALREPPGEAR